MSQDFHLTYLMCSRLCHDLAAPLSAISIGIDMLSSTKDPDCPQKILQYSVRSAMDKLELFRCLVGYTDNPDKPSFVEAVRLINKSIDHEKFQIHWLCRIEDIISGNAVRLIVAIILIAIEALPRGGEILVRPDFSIELTGKYIKLHEEVIEALENGLHEKNLTSRGVVGYFAYLLSCKLGTKVLHTSVQANQIIFRFS